jgi:SAM-dependent methyltransferase
MRLRRGPLVRKSAPDPGKPGTGTPAWEAIQFLSAERELLEAAERAASMEPPSDWLSLLRLLGIEPWARLMWELPAARYPALSSQLPAMSSVDVQRAWTGTSGEHLVLQSTPFLRYALWAGAAYGAPTAPGEFTALDYGCGYGRIARLMLKYVDFERLWGVDPWDHSIELAWQVGFRTDRFLKSDELPRDLPLPPRAFDLVYSFSVFTHLSAEAAAAALSAIARHIRPGGVLVITLRPCDFWNIDFHGTLPEAERATMMLAHDEAGYAFRPHAQGSSDTREALYGDTSWDLEEFQRRFGRWRVVDVDRVAVDPYQLYVTLVLKS